MLLDEVEQVQNPGLGAALIWRFTCGYSEGSGGDAMPLPYAYLVIPFLFQKSVLDAVASTKSGLRKVEEKLSGNTALLASVQDTADAMRELSRDSIALALRAGLIFVDTADATVRARSVTPPGLDDAVAAHLLKAADKLGRWAAGVSLREFCFIFHVEL
ncbi:three component ABC system middle component [Ralstonia sp. 24A2]|uniref:three component ABC system middle component n=1 Tax=Ralstonia sp. 24A2 TaxID=3447364 RepID=UPI003F6972BE